uniref:Uncharacterized protein n=1 Tax=Lepeophtheirus salmonis TaxID=72036 RepID=A0A0K2T7U8_LEPSM
MELARKMRLKVSKGKLLLYNKKIILISTPRKSIRMTRQQLVTEIILKLRFKVPIKLIMEV